MQGLHHRLVDFERRVRVALATSVHELPFGTVVVSEDMPLIYDQNAFVITAPVAPGLAVHTTETVAALLGWEHRTIECGDLSVADALRDALLAEGYHEECCVTMTLDAPVPAPSRATSPATVTAIAEQRPLARAILAEQPWIDGDEVLDQFDERERRLADVASAYAVVAPADAPVSRCLVLTDGPLADIDAVATLSSHRGRGWSDAVMRQAITTARRGGAEHIVLVADADDWPVWWYARLGFREIGRFSQFHRWPDDGDGNAASR